MSGNLYTEQAREQYAPRTRFTGAVLLAVLCVALSLFTFFCPGTEAAVPKPEEISGEYHFRQIDRGLLNGDNPGSAILILRGSTLQLDNVWAGNVQLAYNAAAGTAHTSFTDKHGQLNVYNLRFSKGDDGKVHVSGSVVVHWSYEGKSHQQVVTINGTRTRALGGAPTAPAAPADKSQDKNSAAQNQKKTDSAKSNAGQQKKKDSAKSGAK